MRCNRHHTVFIIVLRSHQVVWILALLLVIKEISIADAFHAKLKDDIPRLPNISSVFFMQEALPSEMETFLENAEVGDTETWNGGMSGTQEHQGLPNGSLRI